jgi:small subunit ribosomal protein S2
MATKEKQLLISLETYLKSGIQIGSKFKTKFMDPFIYKVRSDSLSILNIQKMDERIKVASTFISKYKPEDILVVCRRKSASNAVKMFAQVTGINYYAGRYFPGTLTNPTFHGFSVPKLLIVCDPWQDKNAIKDAYQNNIPVISLCDSSNVYQNIDLIIPCNNKSSKSVGLVFYLIAREYLRNSKKIKKKEELKIPLTEFQE